jgi:hypothetical protein
MKTDFVGCVLRTATQRATPYNVDRKSYFGARSAPYTSASNHTGVSNA